MHLHSKLLDNVASCNAVFRDMIALPPSPQGWELEQHLVIEEVDEA
jgi:hypothetical protein